MMQGKASIRFQNPPHILGTGSVAGEKEGQGPLGELFDEIETDPMCGQENWEAAESHLQSKAAEIAMRHAGCVSADIRYLFAGDLLGQLIATSFGLKNLEIPMFGLYGACSTMGEALSLAAMAVDGGYADKTLALASSHFASAEKQFRFPLAYGNQRPYSATWTVTGCGAVVLGKDGGKVRIAGITTGKIVDLGVKDSMNMGAAMAPAAADLVMQNLIDFDVTPEYYDKVITGDLGTIGQRAMLDLLKEEGVNMEGYHMDCGIEIFDPDSQDTHAGGSGCGCSALTLCGKIIREISSGHWRRVLFIPTGALLSQTSFNEGQTIPGIAHGVILERV
ncbi:stage V sporulation protein AD [Cuneatibacter sp. NSJ-177]|uniref:stage V sporulation protein AD n=1 Tax=Cuneatibacter sp. NSJ-177 TaxID=2931401 RepID=UPI001FD46B32|nr:stage V sporulation protein AD [Cuneatibacter sp. NSJ-177]MCJ7835419.1 stage V sporulation protein AD [Cuneatibacter sp. NSJ-177]